VQKVVPDKLTSNMDATGEGRHFGLNKSIVLHQEEREMSNIIL
jgi:hypothetical protein